MSEHHDDQRTRWDDEEWDKFAILLDKAAPRARYMSSPDLATLTTHELIVAGAKMDRPRNKFSLGMTRKKLLEAYARLRERRDAPPADLHALAQSASLPTEAAGVQESEGRGVIWRPAEWEQFAALLHAANPKADYLHSPDLAMLTIRELRAAGAKMARPRTGFASVSMSRASILAAFARLREKLPGSAEELPTEDEKLPAAGPVGAVRRAPPPSPPPSSLKLDANSRPVASATPTERPQEKPAVDLFAAVAWDRREWLAIATEIDRMYPGSDYSHRENLAGLTSEDVAFAAQRVLPVERQNRHIKVASFNTLRAQLQQGFADLREQRRLQAEAEAARLAQEEAERHTKEALSRAAGPAQQQGEPVGANPYETAFAPLVNMMLGMLVERMRPMIADAINQALSTPAPAAAPAAAQPAPPEAEAPIQVPGAGREKPVLRIGVFGSEVNYAEQLAPHFPNCEFKFVSCDNPNQTESLKSCDYVFVMTKFINHPAMHRAKKMLTDEQFKPVHGSVSDMRRILTGLLHDRTHPAPAQRQPASAFAH